MLSLKEVAVKFVKISLSKKGILFKNNKHNMGGVGQWLSLVGKYSPTITLCSRIYVIKNYRERIKTFNSFF